MPSSDPEPHLRHFLRDLEAKDDVSDAEVERERHRLMGEVVVRRASSVTPQHVEWLWPGRIPFGKLTIIDGHPGQGKSTLTTALVAAASAGQEWPDAGDLDPCGCVILSAEDGMEDTIVPRLMAHGADLDNVHVLEGVYEGGGEPDRPWTLPDDVDKLHYTVRQTDARLVIIDPLMAFLAGRVDAHRDQDVRRALHPLSKMAERTGAAVVIVRHLTKGGAGPAVTRGGGSVGISGAARSVLVVAADPQDSTGSRRIVASAKCNIGPGGAALAFSLVSDPRYGCGRLAWEGESVHTAETVLASVDADEVAEVGRAAEWLKSCLGGQRVPVEELISHWRKAGILDRHVAKARRMLGISESYEGSSVYWQMSA